MSDEFELTPEANKRRTEEEKAKRKAGGGAGWGVFGILALLLAKFKFLLLGLLKLKTLFSMFLFFSVYWAQWGWPYALGIVLSIYIHEMGHVSSLNHYGIKASAPLFIPFVGAFIRVQQRFEDRIQDARVGLAGPLWGLGAAVACYLGYLYFHQPILAALAHTGAFINLFNLIPVWQLDGGRGFHSLDRTQRFLAFGALGLALFLTHQHFLLVLLGFALFQALRKQVPEEGDGFGLAYYAGLVFALSYLCGIPVPGMG